MLYVDQGRLALALDSVCKAATELWENSRYLEDLKLRNYILWTRKSSSQVISPGSIVHDSWAIRASGFTKARRGPGSAPGIL